MNIQKWYQHFRKNQTDRPEPQWNEKLELPEHIRIPLVRSIEQFQLGDGGGPAYLIALDKAKFLSPSPDLKKLVDLWFKEEEEHARLLSHAVKRLGGTEINDHWSFSVFCTVRKYLGVEFELTALLLTEIVSSVYYKLMRKYCSDQPIRDMCSLIIRDEVGHIAFHQARLAHDLRRGHFQLSAYWKARFRMLGTAAGTMLWLNHAPALKALGATRKEFYTGILKGMNQFIKRLVKEAQVLGESFEPPEHVQWQQ